MYHCVFGVVLKFLCLHGCVKLFEIDGILNTGHLKGKFSSGREGALASKFNYDFK